MNCHWFDTHHCRSCGLLDLSYEKTIQKKELELKAFFGHAKINLGDSVHCHPVEHSRNKAKLAVKKEASEIAFGFYDAQMHFKKLEECPLHLEGINDLLKEIKNFLLKYNIIPYDLETKKGELKFLIISKSAESGEIIVRFVVRSKESLDRLRQLAREWIEFNASVKVVSVNIQPDHKAVLEGAEEIVVTEKKYIDYKLGDINLSLGAKSFFQVTPQVSYKLYDTVREILKQNKIQSLLDLYCGVGAFSFFAAQSVQSVVGVEISSEAIETAHLSKNKNKYCGKLDFKSLDVEDFLKNQTEKFEAILVNPPRRGLSPQIVESLMELRPRMIIYSSCQALTLARDVKILETQYDILNTKIFDMFPFTEHFETLMTLVRKQ